MATPPAPDVPIPATPEAVPVDAAAPPQPVGEDSEIRELVQEIVKQTSLGFDPATMKKGIISAIATGTPPTLTLNLSGDTTTTISGVRWLDSYSPVVGDTVLIMKQGPDVLAIGRIADGATASSDWTQASLQAGFSHNGDSQGNLEYRRVWDNGSWKMQWRGAISRSSGSTVVAGLATQFRPATKRTIIAARDDYGGVAVEFQTDGDVVLTGISQTTASTAHSHGAATNNGGSHSHDVNGTTASTNFGGGFHTHGADGSLGTDTQSSHTHGIDSDSHTHTVAANVLWVSLNGVEYFL